MDWMLWYSDENASVADRVIRAAQHFERRYGKKPTKCLLPTEEGSIGSIGAILCETKANVLPCHLMLGVES